MVWIDEQTGQYEYMIQYNNIDIIYQRFDGTITAVLDNFVRILLELRELKNHRLCFAKNLESCKRNIIQIKECDKPLFHTGEEKTAKAKSLTLVFFIQFACAVISFEMIFIQIIRNFVLDEDSANFQIFFIVQLMIQFFPCVNPIIFLS
jgi:hypothetical protein